MKKKIFFIVVLIIVLIAFFWIYRSLKNGEREEQYRFGKVDQGSIVRSVSTTGTLNAVGTVQVGSQVSGQVKELHADFNTEVRRGQIIARIDPVTFEANVQRTEAELAVARANVVIQRAAVERARADLQNGRSALSALVAQTEKARAVLAEAKRDRDRIEALHKRSIVPDSQLDEAVALYDQGAAQVRVAVAQVKAQESLVVSKKAALKMSEAQVLHAEAQVNHMEAVLHRSKVDLEYTIIRSPVDGVVIDRSVDVGQTVAASLQAPTLFTIAEDLRRMQVDANLDEADIGQIEVAQKATFTVDTFPDREFQGEVVEIRKAPETVQNVVTYTVVISTDNPNQRLLPGMTASVQVIVDERKNTLKIPNVALRFRPMGDGGESKQIAMPGGGPPSGPGGPPGRQRGRMAELMNQLDLSEEQRAQLQKITSRTRERLMALRSEGAGPEAMQAEVRRLREEGPKEIMAILTPDQAKKFRQLRGNQRTRQARPARVWVLGADGKPEQVDIVVGIDDGRFTELVRGKLSVGQEVITGFNKAGRTASSGPRRRIGF
jgi:HlyD family secretion protein